MIDTERDDIIHAPRGAKTLNPGRPRPVPADPPPKKTAQLGLLDPQPKVEAPRPPPTRCGKKRGVTTAYRHLVTCKRCIALLPKNDVPFYCFGCAGSGEVKGRKCPACGGTGYDHNGGSNE